MTHNLTVTVEDPLWEEMKKHQDIRWSVVMKEAAREKLKALTVLDRLTKKSKISEKEMEEFAIKLSRKINKRK
jgi:hypothetical protein